MSIYAALTEGFGRKEIRFRIINGSDEAVIAERSVDCDFIDPRIPVETTTYFDELRFPEPGEYFLQVFANEDILMERRIVAVQIEDQGDDDGSSQDTSGEDN